MYQLWDDIVAPVIDALGARRVIEIGALRGETTKRMLERLGPACELHVIDPEPQFDPAEHERAFPGRYHFHRGTSHDVLPGLPPADAVLVDGDHNWFTVYHELRMLADAARQAGVPLPVLVLHDVGWPYGRRDLYYEPDRIPAELRQDSLRAGMRPGESKLVWFGGLNRHMANARPEGGPRNDVMTAVDDFVAEHPQPLRVVVLPIFFGLGIVAEDAVLDAHPALAAFLDHLESPEGTRFLLELGERIRIDEAMLTQAWLRKQEERGQRGADRYLDLIKAVLLDERVVQHELRVSYALGLQGAPPDAAVLRDPARALPHQFTQLARARHAGRPAAGDLGGLALTTMGRAQLDRLEHAAGRVLVADVPGDFAEVGVGGGGGGILLRAMLAAHEVPDRQVWLADTFSATSPGDGAGNGGEAAGAGPPPAVRRLASDLNAVRDNIAQVGLLDDRVRFLQGRPAETLADAPIDARALLRIGEGSGVDAGDVLDVLHPRLSPGAEVIVSGVADPEVEAAVDRARDRLGITAPLERVDWNAAAWTHEEPGGAAAGGGIAANE